jgi:hypothetical protein
MTERRVPALLTAALGTVATAAFATAALAVPATADAPRGAAPARAPEPEPEPTTPTPSEPPPPPAGVEVDAADILVGPAYWQGKAERYTLTVVVRNTGEPAITTSTVVALPAGVQHAGGTPGTCIGSSLTFDCTIEPGQSATVAIQVTVAPGVWRDPPGGSVRTSATAVGGANTDTDEDTFGLVFAPGPPTPGIELVTIDAFLPATATESTESTTLGVRLRNTGQVRAAAIVEVTTPVGVQVATVPRGCAVRTKLSASRERCELGTLAAGQEIALVFPLSVRASARAAAPLTGTVHGSLTPPGQDTATVQASYQLVVVADLAAPTPSADGAVAIPVDDRARPARPGGPPGSRRASAAVSPTLSVLPMVCSIIGLCTVLGAMVILSLRRRLAGP